MKVRGAPRSGSPDRVVLWGTCDTGKPRVRILIEGLRANGVEVIECRSDVWSGVADKSQINGWWGWIRYLCRMAGTYPVLALRYLRLPRHDWVLLGYPAIPDIFVIKLFARLRHTPIAMDWFLSAYDTIVLDRKLIGRRNPLAGFIWLVEWVAIRLADRVFMDTGTHATRMEQLFQLAPGRCGKVWVGAESALFQPPPGKERAARDFSPPPKLLFYGQFIPLHGTTFIIGAARILRDQPIEWLIIGQGQESPRVRQMLDAEPLPRVKWIDWVDYESLQEHIFHADACLGIFGTSDKAASVIPNKVFQALSAHKLVVTRDSPAMRELLGDKCDAAILVPAGDTAALAEAIMRIRSTPSPEEACFESIVASFSVEEIGRQLIENLTRRGKQRD